MCLFTFSSAYLQSELNQLKSLFSLKLGWGTGSKKEIWLWTAFMTIEPIGSVIGAALAGNVLVHGRRKALYLVICCFMLSYIFSQLMGFWWQMASRVVVGLGIGLNAVTVNRYIEEYVPLVMFGTAAPFNTFMGKFGSFLAIMSAVVLPPSKSDPDVVQESSAWRIICLLVVVWLLMALLGLCCFVRHESPKFHVHKGDLVAAVKAVH